ncbi:MAG: crossover junction endodeoxyribonuclease RuvC [Zetaproteobacteria bacterium]|nr:MAG: crossover junction endodeoxyribonuclease RuvC [Zetaproteobacteria bacterium]
MRILGLDPGSQKTGFAVLDVLGGTHRAARFGVWRPRGRTRAERLAMLAESLAALIAETRPMLAAVEEPFVARNARSALALGEARGALLAECARAKVPVRGFAPSAVKQAITGYGRADKAQIQFMVQRLLGLARAPAEDAADALAVAWCCAAHCAQRVA